MGSIDAATRETARDATSTSQFKHTQMYNGLLAHMARHLLHQQASSPSSSTSSHSVVSHGQLHHDRSQASHHHSTGASQLRKHHSRLMQSTANMLMHVHQHQHHLSSPFKHNHHHHHHHHHHQQQQQQQQHFNEHQLQQQQQSQHVLFSGSRCVDVVYEYLSAPHISSQYLSAQAIVTRLKAVKFCRFLMGLSRLHFTY